MVEAPVREAAGSFGLQHAVFNSRNDRSHAARLLYNTRLGSSGPPSPLLSLYCLSFSFLGKKTILLGKKLLRGEEDNLFYRPKIFTNHQNNENSKIHLIL